MVTKLVEKAKLKKMAGMHLTEQEVKLLEGHSEYSQYRNNLVINVNDDIETGGCFIVSDVPNTITQPQYQQLIQAMFGNNVERWDEGIYTTKNHDWFISRVDFKVVTAYEEFRRESGSTDWPIEVCTARELADSVDHFIPTYGGLDYDDLADDDFDD